MGQFLLRNALSHPHLRQFLDLSSMNVVVANVLLRFLSGKQLALYSTFKCSDYGSTMDGTMTSQEDSVLLPVGPKCLLLLGLPYSDQILVY